MTRARARQAVEPKEGMGFSDPPTPPKRYDWEVIAKRCRRRPNRWYQVFEQDRQTLATAIRQDGIAALQSRKGFVVKTANNNIKVTPRTCDLWVMYVPENDTEESK